MTLLDSDPRPLTFHRNALNSGWTAERVALLKELWSVKQWTATDIALELGGFEHCTDGGRSAVIGKVHRLKLPERPSDHSGQSKATNRASRPQTRHIACHILKVARDSAEKPIAEAAPEVALDIPADQRVPLLALTHEGCRFPLGEPGDPDFGFCPGKQRDDSSYCAAHHHLAYTPRAPGRPHSQRVDMSWG